MNNLLTNKKNSESKVIKRQSIYQITQISINKRKSSINAQKKMKLGNLNNRRGTIFEQQAIKPISLTFQNNPETIKLIKYIKLYKEMNTKKVHDEEGETMKKYLIDKIVLLLKSNRGFFNFFSFYQINEKAINRLARGLHFVQKEKDDCIYYENDNSNKVYFLLKGKLSFKKYLDTPYERDAYQMSENNIFGMFDVLYERKRKLSCLPLEDCSYLSFSKDIFKLYMEENVSKVLFERKKFLFRFFKEYLPLPPTKIERYITNCVENLFFRKNEIIYKEGDKNISLYIIFIGEANLVANLTKNEFDILPNFSLPMVKIKENAKNIEYGKLIDNCKKEMLQNKEENSDISNFKNNNYKVMCTLSKGSICGGMEISCGITSFKYNLICNSDFCAILQIKLELFEDEHLKTFMVNLLPNIISKERKIYKIKQNIKYLDNIINPPSCQKFKESKDIPSLLNNRYNSAKTDPLAFYKKEQINKKNFNDLINDNTNISQKPIKTENNFIPKTEEKISPNLIISVNENESNKTYQKLIKRIDDKFDTNEGGFIKLSNYNLDLLVQKNFLKSQISNNKKLDMKVDNYIKICEEKERNNLKTSNLKMNYLLNEESFKNNNENSMFNIKTFGILNSPNKLRYTSANKKKIKLWNFQYMNKFENRNKTFVNFYTNNFKIDFLSKFAGRKTQKALTRRKLQEEMNDMIEKIEKAYAIKQSRKNIKIKEIYDKLVSFKSLKSEKDDKHQKKSYSKNKNFIKELIIMKKSTHIDEYTDTLDKDNSFNLIDIKKENNEDQKNDVIKVINKKYIQNWFFNNLNRTQSKNNKGEIQKIKKNFFDEVYLNKYKNYDKSRILLYNTGQFDMPLATNIISTEK